MRFLGSLLRVYSYIFEAILCFLALAMAVIIFANPAQTINLGWLPWSADSLPNWLLAAALTGLISILLAATGKFRLLHFLFAVAAFVILVRGLFLGSWTFQGTDEVKRAIWLVLAAVIAALGALPIGTRRSPGSSRV